MKEILEKIVAGNDLSRSEAQTAMDAIMSGQTTDAQIGAFLIALRMKGETSKEIAGFADVMRRNATPISVTGDVVDTCGTGGDGLSTFNISTAAAIVAAGAGVKIAKHGNRSVSSSSGSADVLLNLGVNIEAKSQVVERCIEEAGIGFMFAPLLHAAMKHAIGPRRELALRTVFNLLGPLTNPAGAKRQVMGVFDINLTERIAQVLLELGATRAMVLTSEDGLDEISSAAATKITHVQNGELKTELLQPSELGIKEVPLETLVVKDATSSAEVIKQVLNGEDVPARSIVLLNAAAAILVADNAETWNEAIELAASSIDEGKARDTLAKLVEISNAE